MRFDNTHPELQSRIRCAPIQSEYTGELVLMPRGAQDHRLASVRDWITAQIVVRASRFNRYPWFPRLRQTLIRISARDHEYIRIMLPPNVELFLPCWDSGLIGSVLRGPLLEPTLLRVLEQIVLPGTIAIDGGAHIGLCTITMARCLQGKGRVIAFEPDPRNFAVLQKNIRANQMESVTDAVQIALAENNGERDLWISPAVSTCSSLVRVGSIGDLKTRVVCTQLDDYLERERLIAPAVVKLDLEGAEPECLEGMKRTLNEVKYLVLELNLPRLLAQGKDPIAFIDGVAEKGSFDTVSVCDEDNGALVSWDAGKGVAAPLARYGYVNVLLQRNVNQLL